MAEVEARACGLGAGPGRRRPGPYTAPHPAVNPNEPADPSATPPLRRSPGRSFWPSRRRRSRCLIGSAPAVMPQGQAHREVDNKEQDHSGHQNGREQVQQVERVGHESPSGHCRQPAPAALTLSIRFVSHDNITSSPPAGSRGSRMIRSGGGACGTAQTKIRDMRGTIFEVGPEAKAVRAAQRTLPA